MSLIVLKKAMSSNVFKAVGVLNSGKNLKKGGVSMKYWDVTKNRLNLNNRATMAVIEKIQTTIDKNKTESTVLSQGLYYTPQNQ
jgi:hypothetical protein